MADEPGMFAPGRHSANPRAGAGAVADVDAAVGRGCCAPAAVAVDDAPRKRPIRAVVRLRGGRRRKVSMVGAGLGGGHGVTGPTCNALDASARARVPPNARVQLRGAIEDGARELDPQLPDAGTQPDDLEAPVCCNP